MPVPDSRLRTARLTAIVAGLLGFLLAILTPVLPVKQEASSVDWPQAGTASIETPLISYAPLSFEATIPCAAINGLGDGTDGALLSTIPTESRGPRPRARAW